MMIASRNPIVRRQHIRYEIEGISKALHGVDRSRYLGDYLLQRAAERALLIVSEATRSLPGELFARYPEVDWRGIVQLGNILRHEYPMVDSEVLWEIITRKLPELRPVIDRMINELGG